MIDFTFNGRSSNDFGIYTIDLDRTLLPEKVNNSIEIPNRSGSLELDETQYKNRIITIQIGVLGNYTEQELRQKARDIAVWLSKKGQLIFDDEPDKCYIGRIYNSVNFVRYGSNDYLSDSFNSAVSDIEFVCQPFAESKDLNKISSNAVGTANLNVENKGTANTQAVIVIKNIGTNTINNVRITRKVVI